MPEVRIDHLPDRLVEGMDPVYLLAGEEPLLIEEALDALRRHARDQGFHGREVLHADGQFDWERLQDVARSLSLFSDRRLVEVRLPGGRPGKEGAAALREYAAAPPADVVLVLIAGKLEPAQRKSAWASAMARAGVMSYAWPVKRQDLRGWINRRARSVGLVLDADAVSVLAERNEGNLLAVAQEVDKLRLLGGDRPLGVDRVREAVADGARFAVFDLPDAVLEGDVSRTIRVLRRLRAEGEEPVLVLWGLSRDLRVLAELQAAGGGGADSQAVLRRHRVWRNRQSRLQRLARSAPDDAWPALLARAAAVDRVLKGAERRRPWDELIELATDMARISAPH